MEDNDVGAEDVTGKTNEVVEPNEPDKQGELNEPNGKSTIDSYKTVCAKLGLSMSLYYVCRFLGGIIAGEIARLATFSGNHTAAYMVHVIVLIIMNYVIPLYIVALLFKSFRRYSGKMRELYRKPRRIARALGSLPAMYGLGYGIALLTLLSSYLISKITGGQTFIENILRPPAMEPAANIPTAIVLFLLLVVVAPIFEELWVRGIMYDALKPYGCGVAIIITSILFGLMHGSLHMLLYTTALGLALGYVRYATGSLFAVTILHSIINMVAGGYLLLSSLTEITNESNKLINTITTVYLVAMLVLIIVGLVAFFARIPTIKRYKIENAWDEISGWKKTALFFVSIPVIIMLILAFNEHTNDWLLRLFM